MTFKAKLRKIGNSIGVLIPRQVITDYEIGEDIELEVITKGVIKEEGYNIATQSTTSGAEHYNAKKLVFNPKTGLEEWM